MRADKIWSGAPAEAWSERYPIGNGRIGVMDDGGIAEQSISINDDRFWSGNGADKTVKAPEGSLDAARDAVGKGKFGAAERILEKNIYGEFTESYLPLANMTVKRGLTDLGGYKRELGLSNAELTVKADGFSARSHVSCPDACYRLDAEHEKTDLTLGVSSHWRSDCAVELTDFGAIISLTGTAPSHTDPVYHQTENAVVYDDGNPGVSFALVIAVVTDGTPEIKSDKLAVKNASYERLIAVTEVELHPERDIAADARSRVNELLKISYDDGYNKHAADYKSLYERNSFALDNADSLKPTAELLKTEPRDRDNTLYELLYNFGRYLLISSSRLGTFPANLQGIWNDDPKPPWSSNYTININTEMNYWHAETTNLSELHMPLIDLILAIAKNGEKVAKETFGCRGWTVGHNSDRWGHANPVGADSANSSSYALCVPSAGWLCRHIFEHYAFTGDAEFLKNNIDILNGAARFYLDYMTVDHKTGKLVTNPSASPENRFTKFGMHAVNKCSTMDISVIRELFGNLIAAYGILGIADPLKDEMTEALAKLLPYRVGKGGRLSEWYADYRETDKHHRHLSHLYALYPGEEFTQDKTPELIEASRRSLVRRGLDGTGWSKAWKIGLYARLKDGETALKCIDSQLTFVNAAQKMALKGGTYSSLLCAHPPFQIDGNFGAAAGIAELLMQSHGGYIDILPALPAKWKNGKILGLKARGGYTVDIEWTDNKATLIKVTGGKTQKFKIKINGEIKDAEAPFIYKAQ